MRLLCTGFFLAVLLAAPPLWADGPGDPLPRAADTPNRKPRWQLTWTGGSDGVSAPVGRELALELRAQDDDGDELTFGATGVPAGAVLEPQRFPYPAVFRWTPRLEDVGTHEVAFTVSDGPHTVPALLRVRVVAPAPVVPPVPVAPKHEVSTESNWTTYAMPGLGATVLVPAQSRTWGAFVGGGVEFLVAAWIHSNDNRGPSHGRVVINLDVLKPTNQEGAALQTSLGVDLSIERNPARTYLVPFYGLSLGALVHRNLESSAFAHATPMLGVHLFSSRNVFLTTSVGYLLPLSGRYFDELRSIRANVSADVSFW
jgi:hypothetical protein